MPYAPATFSCPHCRAPLRLRDRPMGSARFPCPDCKRPLELTDESGELLVRPAIDVTPKASVTRKTRQASLAAAPAMPAAWWPDAKAAAARRLSDPLVVTWLAAGLAATALVVVVVRERTANPGPGVGASDSASVAAATTSRSDEASTPESAEAAQATVFAESAPAVIDEPTALVASAVDRPPPVVAPKPPASLPVDPREEITARLSQQLLRFEQPTPVAFDVLRSQIEEMAGVSIRYDEVIGSDRRHRDAAVSLSLADVTLEEVIREAARQAGLSPVVEPDGVRLVPGDAGLQALHPPAADPAAVR